MRQEHPRSGAAIGFTVKSGWASAVLLIGSSESPHVVDSRRVELSDPARPECRQPYHAGFGTGRSTGPELSSLIASVKGFGRKSVTGVIRQYQTAGHHLRGVGVVVGSLIDPERIANDHIRIHALEGRLFRTVVENAAVVSRLRVKIWRERDLYALAAAAFHQPEPSLRGALVVLGRTVAGPWRAEQKAAALAAWLVLARARGL
jgi:hypothetical protein